MSETSVLASEPTADGRRRERHWLALLVALAFLARLLVALPGLRHPTLTFSSPDTPDYMQPARALLRTGQYNRAPGSPLPAVYRPPLFPVVLAGTLFVGGDNPGVAAVFFCLVSALTCVPIYRAAKSFGGAATGGIAALLFAVNLTSLANAPLLLSDTCFAFLAAWQFYFAARFYFDGRPTDLYGMILFAGVGALTRPINLVWIVPGVLLAGFRPGLPNVQRGRGAIGALALFALLVLPWMLRNQRVGAGFRLETNQGDTIYFQNGSALASRLTGEPATAIRQRWVAEAEAEFRAHPDRYPDENSRVNYKLARASALFRRYPLTYARLQFQPTVLAPDAPIFLQLLGATQGNRGTLDVLRTRGMIAAVRYYFGGKLYLLLFLTPLIFVIAAMYLAAFWQGLRWIRQRNGYALLLFAAFVGYYLILPGPVPMPRYQLAALPMLTTMAALPLAQWRQNQRAKKSGRGEKMQNEPPAGAVHANIALVQAESPVSAEPQNFAVVTVASSLGTQTKSPGMGGASFGAEAAP